MSSLSAAQPLASCKSSSVLRNPKRLVRLHDQTSACIIDQQQKQHQEEGAREETPLTLQEIACLSPSLERTSELQGVGGSVGNSRRRTERSCQTKRRLPKDSWSSTTCDNNSFDGDGCSSFEKKMDEFWSNLLVGGKGLLQRKTYWDQTDTDGLEDPWDQTDTGGLDSWDQTDADGLEDARLQDSDEGRGHDRGSKHVVQTRTSKNIARFFLWVAFLVAISSNVVANGEPKHSVDISSANLRLREKLILDEIIGPDNYDKRIRPAGHNDTGPTVVFINIMIRNVQTISDVKMEYSIQITFREQWLDSRLKFDDMNGKIQYLTLTETDMVWMPDLFFRNEKDGHFHKIILPNLYIRIFPNGEVLYSIRISLTLSCPMDLKLFPLDRQQCQLYMASYGWTTEDLVFMWKDKGPVQVTPNLHLPRFTLEKFITDYCNSKTNTGEYSCLRVDFIFKREFSYYLVQFYIPCCMLVIVSWVSFWLDPNAVPARVALGVTTLLNMSTHASSINQSLPPVSYTKAIDVWTGVCLTFVFGALLEFALVNYASRSDKHREKLKEKLKEWEVEHQAALQAQMEQADHSNSGDGHSAFAMKPLVSRHNGGMGNSGGGGGHGDKAQPCQVHLTQTRGSNCCRTWLSKFPTRSKRIDVISRIIFPMVFAFFNLAYWSTYLFTEEKEDHLPKPK